MHPNEVDTLVTSTFRTLAAEAKALGKKFVEALHIQRERQILTLREQA